MAPLRCSVVFGVLVAVAHAVTPIEKVTTLLEDLKKGVEAEGKKEATAYDKFACFCKDTTKDKSKSITEGQDKIDTTTADIGLKTADKEDKITELGKEKQKVEDATAALEKATEAYNKDKTAYQATIADLTKALSSTKNALKALKASKGGAAFLDVGRNSDLRTALDLADALGFTPPSKKEAVTVLLQGKVDPDDPEYKFHSDKIIKIIEDLEKDFKANKEEVQTEWEKTDKAYKAEKKDLEEKIDTAKKEIKTLTGDIDKLTEEIAKLKNELEEANSALEDDSKYLKDLTVRCEEKAQAWDQRSSVRNDEVQALTKAIEILKDKVKDADKVNKRALLLAKQKPVEAKKAEKKVVAKSAKNPTTNSTQSKPKAPSFLQEAEATRGFLSKVSLVQLDSSKAKESVVELLQREGTRLNSIMLSSLANQIAGDPFVKIKKMIQNLIERIVTEARQEATKKGFCDTELGKAYETRKSRYSAINQLDADISELKAKKAELSEEIKELKADVKSLKEALKKATEVRKTEKTDNEETIKKAKEGAEAVGEALVILKDFYKSAAKEKFLQVGASPVDEDDPGAGFGGAYKGDQDSSKAILGLLEVIKSDFERTNRKTEAAEKKALEEYVLFERSSKSDIASKETKIELDKQDLDATESAYDQAMKDLKTAVKVLDATLKTIEDLKPTCIDTGMSYKERVEKREEEIEALKKALCMLDAEKVEPECK